MSSTFPFLSPRARSSTAQKYLAKIIAIIATVPPPPSPIVSICVSEEISMSIPAPAIAVDLDLRLGSEMIAVAIEDDERIPTAHSAVVDSGEMYAIDKISVQNLIRNDSASQPDFRFDDFSAGCRSSEGECSAVVTSIEKRGKPIAEVTNTSIIDKISVQNLNCTSQPDFASDDFSAGCRSSEGECSAVVTSIEKRGKPISKVTNSSIIDKTSVQNLTADDSVSQPDFTSDDFSAGCRSSEGECSAVITSFEQSIKPISKITNTSIIDEKAEDGKTIENANDGEGFLDLLLEAARQISNDVDENGSSIPPSISPPDSNLGKRKTITSGKMLRSKRRRKIPPAEIPFNVYQKTEPVVRSNRGRTQALPSRYRDSILDPWRKPPTVLRR